ncbi:MAG: hypothetical protein ACTSWR_00645 [Candidatus Helarchaeota archaeon]
MKHFLIKIFNNEIDESIHDKFLRYSKGEFEGPVLDLVIRGKKVSFYVDRDYDQYFLDFILRHLPSNDYKVSGNIITKSDPEAQVNDLKIQSKITKSKGLYNIKLNDIYNLEKLKEIYKELKKIGYPLLSISSTIKGNPWKITTKKSIPRPSANSKESEEKEKHPNFCKGTFPRDQELLNEVIQDCLLDFIEIADELKNQNFHELQLQNIFNIEKILLPDPKIKEDLIKEQKRLNDLIKKSNDPQYDKKTRYNLKKEIKELSKNLEKRSEEFRLLTKRTGEIIRILKIDEKKTYNNKYSFEA